LFAQNNLPFTAPAKSDDTSSAKNNARLIGSPFPELKVFDTAHHATTFSLDTGFIYLIDYWASWCNPCIVYKLPVLKALYAKYGNKRFRIVSLSLDKDFNAWIGAIRKNKITWENYSALTGFKTTDAELFNITGIPFTILVGKGNKIVKTDPSQSDVEAYLDQM
jgi:thiol-disulfide isomerase/thioredoxin